MKRFKNQHTHDKFKRKLSKNRSMLIRGACEILAVQLLILGAGISIITGNWPVNIEDTTQITIVVENIEYSSSGRGTKSSTHLDIYAKGVPYRMSKGTPTVSELYEMIEVDDEISLAYIKKISWFRKRNFIVAAHTDTEIYRTLEDYNSPLRYGSAIVFFLIIEIGYILGVVVLWKKVIKQLL